MVGMGRVLANIKLIQHSPLFNLITMSMLARLSLGRGEFEYILSAYIGETLTKIFSYRERRTAFLFHPLRFNLEV